MGYKLTCWANIKVNLTQQLGSSIFDPWIEIIQDFFERNLPEEGNEVPYIKNESKIIKIIFFSISLQTHI